LWAILILANLLVLIVFAFSVPLYVVLHVDVYGRPEFRMRLAWFFGLVSKEITKNEKKPEYKKEEDNGKGKPGKRGPGAKTILKILRARGLLGQIKLLLKGILSAPRTKDLAADLKVGLGDPADTGLLFVFIGPATSFLGSYFPDRIKVRPSFADEAVLEGSLHGTLRLRPVQLIPPLLRFVLSLPAIRVVKILAVTKWRRKK